MENTPSRPSECPSEGSTATAAAAAFPGESEALQQALERIKSLEGVLSTLKREHERTTAKLAHVLKKRGVAEDTLDHEETEASQELHSLRQQVFVLKWREEQFRLVMAKAAAGRPGADASLPPAQQTSPSGVANTIFVGAPRQSSSGSSASSTGSSSSSCSSAAPRVVSAAPRVVEPPSRQMTPPAR